MIYGVDVSSYQSTTLPAKANGKKVDFVFVKATEGTGYINPNMKAQAADARRKGLVLGFYHFVRPGSMAAQAKYFVEKCDSVEGDLLVLDWEDPGVSNSDKNAFIAEVKRLRGATHRVGLYCNVSFWKTRDKGSKCGDFLWIAHYGVSAGKPGIQDRWVIHQYTDKTIDTNVADFSSRAEMKKWATKSTTATEESELESMDKKSAYNLFWTGDFAPAPSTSSTIKENPTWMPVSLLVGGYEQTAKLRKEVKALRDEIASLASAVAKISGTCDE